MQKTKYEYFFISVAIFAFILLDFLFVYFVFESGYSWPRKVLIELFLFFIFIILFKFFLKYIKKVEFYSINLIYLLKKIFWINGKIDSESAMIKRLLILSTITGITVGASIVIYTFFTKWLKNILFFGEPIYTISTLPIWYVLLVPTVSILFINFLISKNPNLKEYGVTEIAEAIENNKLTISVKDLFVTVFASSLSLASGFAIGNEGPSAVIGAIIAQKFHNILKLNKKILKVSLSIGAGAGITAVFVSPLTGIMFAIETLAYNFVKKYSGYLILASISSFFVAIHFSESLFFKYSNGKFIENKYAIATFIFVPVVTFFIYFYLSLKDIVMQVLQNLDLKIERYLLVLASGLMIGVILIISPYAAFSGHQVVSMLINDKFHIPLSLIFIIIVFRIVATTISIYANAIGGIFIALMSIGALVGYGFSEVLCHFSYFNTIEPFYFAVIGASVFMGVNMKLPLTALVMALEITYDYNVIIPTGFSVVIVGYLVSLQFSIKKLSYKGIRKLNRKGVK